MTLNHYETTRTSHELHANLIVTGMTLDDVARDLGWTRERVDHAFAVDDAADPVDVWELRDFIEETADGHAEFIPFTVLTEQSRLAARTWFTLRTPPKRAPR